jgi:hypothetical protein
LFIGLPSLCGSYFNLYPLSEVTRLLFKNKSLTVRPTQLPFFILVHLHVSVAFDHRRAISIVLQTKVKMHHIHEDSVGSHEFTKSITM